MLGASLIRDVLRVLRCAGLAGLSLLSLLILAATSHNIYGTRHGADSITTLASSTTVVGRPVSVGASSFEYSDQAQSFALALDETEDDGSANDTVHEVVIPAVDRWQVNLDGLHYSAGWQSWCRVPRGALATQLARGPPV
jgi:hypothetical protein